MGKQASGGSQSVTVTYHAYYAGWHMVPCLTMSDVHLLELQVNDVTAFSGDQAGSGSIVINQPELFGGKEREGGVVGTFDFMDGKEGQGQNSYLTGVLGSTVPAYLGSVSLVARKPELQSNSPFLKPWRMKLACFPTEWYPAKCVIYGTESYTETVRVQNPIQEDDTSSCTWDRWSHGECDIPGEARDYRWYSDPLSEIGIGDSNIPDEPPEEYLDRWELKYPSFYPGDPIWVYSGQVSPDWLTAPEAAAPSPGYTETTTIHERQIYIGTNAAHIVYFVATDKVVGKGLSEDELDLDSLTDAADILYAEGFALSIVWSKQTSVDGFIQLIMDHINGAFFRHPVTGKYTLKLFREGETASVIIPSSSIIRFEEYEDSGWAGVINELTVKYVDVVDGKEKSITVHDLAGIDRQGAIISETKEYLGLPTIELAERVARRELALSTANMKRVRIVTDRSTYYASPGDIAAITWPRYGMDGEAFRILEIDYGTQLDNEISIIAVADQYTVDQPSTIAPQIVVVVEPLLPLNARPVIALEAPYWIVDRMTQNYGFPVAVQPSYSYLLAVAGNPQSNGLNFKTQFQNGPDPVVSGATGQWCGSALTRFNVDREDTYLLLDRTYAKNLEKFIPGTPALFGSNEIIEVVEFDLATWALIVNRGIMDTVPVTHLGGETINTISPLDNGFSREEWFAGDIAKVKALTTTPGGVLAAADATELLLPVTGRQGRPLPPGGFRVNGGYLAPTFSNELTVSWKHRNRLTQTTSYFPTQDDDTVLPEAGTTYRLRIYSELGDLLREVNTANESYTYLLADEITDYGELNAKLSFELTTLRDGYESFTSWSHTAYRDLKSTTIPLVNPCFATGDGTGWQILSGAPEVQSAASLGWSACPSGSAYFLGAPTSDTVTQWSIGQEILLTDYASPNALNNGLAILEIEVVSRSALIGPMAEQFVVFSDSYGNPVGGILSTKYAVVSGTCGTQTLSAPIPAGSRVATVGVTMSGNGGANVGYVSCLSVDILGRLQEDVFLTALTAVVATQDPDVRLTAVSPSAIIQDPDVRLTAISPSALIQEPDVRLTAISPSALVQDPDVRVTGFLVAAITIGRTDL